MRICVVGDPEDLTAVYLAHLARRRGLEVLELPESGLGVEWSFAFDDGSPAEGRLLRGREEHPFRAVAGLFVRLPSTPDLPPEVDDMDVGPRTAFVRERRAALQHLADRFPGPVANRPAAGRSNGSKPYQMESLAADGFDVPRWIATNEPERARRFVDGCPEGAVYKSCSGLRSRVRRATSRLLERLAAGTAPVVVQEYVPGRDVRVHTVEEAAFGTEIVSAGVDYRFAGEESTYRPAEVPADVRERCVRRAREEGLTLAGFDFRVTDGGAWRCLEVNPVPTFLPYEMTAEQPIGDAVLDVLTAGPRTD